MSNMNHISGFSLINMFFPWFSAAIAAMARCAASAQGSLAAFAVASGWASLLGMMG